MSWLQVFVISKGIFPLQGAIIIQLWTVLWHVVLERKHGEGFVFAVSKKLQVKIMIPKIE